MKIQEHISNFPKIKVGLCMGGDRTDDEERDILCGMHILVGTLGRILHHIDSGVLLFDQVKTIFITDICKLLSVPGFPAIVNLYKHIYEDMQVVSCGKEMNEYVKEYNNICSKNCSFIEYSPNSLIGCNVVQEIEKISSINKSKLILSTLRKTPPPVIIFINAEDHSNELPDLFKLKGINYCYISREGDRYIHEEELKEFFDRKHDVLIMDMVLAQSFHLPNVNHVINYDVPSTIDDFIYTTSRCGRRDKIGVATTYIDKNYNIVTLCDIRDALTEDKQLIPKFLKGI